MEAVAADEVFLFEGFRLDLQSGDLFRVDENGDLVAVTIGSRALQILVLLVMRHGGLVSKDEIMTAVWPGMVVEDSNLPTQISALRRALDRGRSPGSCIQTVSGRGYRFIAKVHRLPAQNPSDASACGDATGSPVAESSHSAPVVPERGLSGGLPPTMVSDGEQGKNRIPDPAALFTIDAGLRRRRLGFALHVAASLRRLARIPALATVVPIGVTLVLGLGAWWLWSTTKPGPVATSIPAPLVSPRLSIVVLPFTNLSNNPGQQYFADGMADDLTTELSQIPDSFVISRNTAFTYRNKPADTKQIGRELGVRYVLEGSVQRSGSQVRVNAQLIDAEADALLWAEQFDRNTLDLFALQDEITGRIRNTLGIELISREAARPTERPDALDYSFRARAAFNKPPTRENYVEVISLLERALALDPQSAEAKSRLASVLMGRVLNNMTDSAAADLERAKALSEQALASSPRSPLAHYSKGQVLRVQRRYAEAISEYEAVLASDRNSAYSFYNIGQCKLFTGLIEETIPLTERAIRLSPRDPFALGSWYQQIGLVHLLQSRTDEAIIWLEKARNHSPAHSGIRANLASAYALNGETERASDELAEARRLSTDDRWSRIASMRAPSRYWGVAKIRALFEATYFAGLRKAGMPED
ncbi:MAG TPA: winged helix-turn-helix domain-containing tetratricopeptide repeat protein [Stellaceae bacterium]|nr:winged helix-turn-helix domain-containing tetratricopeptide repeat protein [Stellaceae bacterium]